jgi:hypothetical protein
MTNYEPITLPLVEIQHSVPPAEGSKHRTHLPGPWGPPLTRTWSIRSSRHPVVLCPGNAHNGSNIAQKGPNTPPLVLDRLRVPPPRARSICHTFRSPGSNPSYVPGRFEAAAAPSFVPWAMHTEGQRLTKKKGPNTPPHERDQCPVPPRRSPEASVSPSGSLGTALHTYQVGLKQPPPRRLCPGRYTPRGSKVEI